MPRYRRDKTSLWVNLSDDELKAIKRMAKRLHSQDPTAFPVNELTSGNVVRMALHALADQVLGWSVLPPDVFAVVKIGRPPQRKSAA